MNRVLFAVSIVAVVVLAAVFYTASQSQPQVQSDVVTQNSDGSWSLSEGGLAFTYPSEFGLVVNENQILASYIPPCNPGFDYCLHYLGPKYQGTNFDSAGIRIDTRDDFSGELCLTKPPLGHDLTPGIVTNDRYVTARFAPLGGAGAGHYSTGALYRIWYEGGCYELETRIGLSQFANYEPGSIREFTADEQSRLESALIGIVENIAFADTHEKLMFPR